MYPAPNIISAGMPYTVPKQDRFPVGLEPFSRTC